MKISFAPQLKTTLYQLDTRRYQQKQPLSNYYYRHRKLAGKLAYVHGQDT